MKKNKKVSLSKKPFLVLSRRAIAGWLGVIFILCAWMFVVGILVGRGTAPVKFKIDGLHSKLEIPGQKGNQEQKGPAQGESGLGEDKTKFDFYEALPEDRQDFKIDEKKSAPVISKKVEPSPAQKPPSTNGEKATPENKLKKQADPKAGFKKKQPAKQPVAAKTAPNQPEKYTPFRWRLSKLKMKKTPIVCWINLKTTAMPPIARSAKSRIRVSGFGCGSENIKARPRPPPH